jgi:hypothetical protein
MDGKLYENRILHFRFRNSPILSPATASRDCVALDAFALPNLFNPSTLHPVSVSILVSPSFCFLSSPAQNKTKQNKISFDLEQLDKKPSTSTNHHQPPPATNASPLKSFQPRVRFPLLFYFTSPSPVYLPVLLPQP